MNKQHLFLYRLFLAISDAQQSSIAKKCFDIWVILKMATVKSLEPRNNSLRINHIIRCRSKPLLFTVGIFEISPGSDFIMK